MNMLLRYKFLVSTLLIAALLLVAAETASSTEFDDWFDGEDAEYIEDTCEGPEGDYTWVWYAFRALDTVDTTIQQCCETIHREDLFLMWRSWLLERHHIRMC